MLIALTALATAVIVWWLMSKWLYKHHKAKWKVRLVSIPSALFAFVIAVGILVPAPEETGSTKPAQTDTSAQEKQQPSPEKKVAATLNLSTNQLLKDIVYLERRDVPATDGIAMEKIRVNELLVLEANGDNKNLSSYSMVFTFSKKNTFQELIEVISILSNTFPSWQGKQDNPAIWFSNSLKKITDAYATNPEEPVTIEFSKEGKKVKMEYIFGVGFFFIHVEPI